MDKQYVGKFQKRLNNEGSTLITVIVAIAFVTILVTIILGTTVVNVRMKGIDRRTHDDFYYAEKSLNDIYTGLGQEFVQIAGDEYEKSFNKVGIEDPSGDDFNMAETAEKDFRKNFVKEVYDKFTATDADGLKTALDADGLKAALQKYVLPSSKGVVESVGYPVVYQTKDGSTATESNADRVVIKDVTVSVTDSSGFQSVISTDIVINTPTVDFLGTNADVSDYGLIANEGLYIKGNAKITGNVYAGVDSDEYDNSFTEVTDSNARDGVYGGINISNGTAEFKGNYIVSKGDINLSGTKPQLKVYTPDSTGGTDMNLANLWFTSLRILSKAAPDGSSPATNPTVDINANVFALNDLLINADNTSVKINGNYYGYNDKTLTLSTLGVDSSKREDGVSSAIVVNGSKAYLDMKDINNLVLMGKAYIDFTSDSSTDPGTVTQVVPTAESVALKTNQQLYLVPTDFLDGPNPSTSSSTFNITVPESDLQNWFGYKYLATSGGATKIDENYTVKLTDGTTEVYYDYLKFNENNAWKPQIDSTTNKIIKDPVTKHDRYDEVPDATPSSSTPLGTGGSISSKAKFFLDIMTAEEDYKAAYTANKEGYASETEYIEAKEAAEVQPSAYRLFKRIELSMGYEYFNLEQCVVGDKAHSKNAHYYAKNAVVNYERVTDPDDPAATVIQSNVLTNTEGMGRYANYTQNLFRRYVWLCTRLDGKEDVLLDSDPGDPGVGEWKITYSAADGSDKAPICHFVKMANVTSMSVTNSIDEARKEGLKPGAYGVVIATNGDLNLSSVPAASLTSGKFKGVAISKGDITVPDHMNVDGLLMAGGKIILEGNNEINYDKGLIQSRIEKEMNIVKNKDESTSDSYGGEDGYKNYYLISYLSKDAGAGTTPQLIYNVEPGSEIKRDRIEADYNDFMHYENWQKGANDATPTSTPTSEP